MLRNLLLATTGGQQTLQILAIKVVRVISLYCPITDIVNWKEVEHIVASLFPLIKYSKMPVKVREFVDKAAVAMEFKDYSEGRRLSEYACLMVCKHINMLITHIMDIVEEARVPGKLTNQMIRTAIFSDPIFTDMLPFLCDQST